MSQTQVLVESLLRTFCKVTEAFGFSLKEVDELEWEAMLDSIDASNPMYPLRQQLRRGLGGTTSLDSQSTQSCLNLAPPPDFDATCENAMRTLAEWLFEFHPL